MPDSTRRVSARQKPASLSTGMRINKLRITRTASGIWPAGGVARVLGCGMGANRAIRVDLQSHAEQLAWRKGQSLAAILDQLNRDVAPFYDRVRYARAVTALEAHCHEHPEDFSALEALGHAY